MKTKSLLTIVLLVFVAASVTAMVLKEVRRAPEKAPGAMAETGTPASARS